MVIFSVICFTGFLQRIFNCERLHNWFTAL